MILPGEAYFPNRCVDLIVKIPDLVAALAGECNLRPERDLPAGPVFVKAIQTPFNFIFRVSHLTFEPIEDDQLIPGVLLTAEPASWRDRPPLL